MDITYANLDCGYIKGVYVTCKLRPISWILSMTGIN